MKKSPTLLVLSLLAISFSACGNSKQPSKVDDSSLDDSTSITTEGPGTSEETMQELSIGQAVNYLVNANKYRTDHKMKHPKIIKGVTELKFWLIVGVESRCEFVADDDKELFQSTTNGYAYMTQGGTKTEVLTETIVTHWQDNDKHYTAEEEQETSEDGVETTKEYKIKEEEYPGWYKILHKDKEPEVDDHDAISTAFPCEIGEIQYLSYAVNNEFEYSDGDTSREHHEIDWEQSYIKCDGKGNFESRYMIITIGEKLEDGVWKETARAKLEHVFETKDYMPVKETNEYLPVFDRELTPEEQEEVDLAHMYSKQYYEYPESVEVLLPDVTGDGWVYKE